MSVVKGCVILIIGHLPFKDVLFNSCAYCCKYEDSLSRIHVYNVCVCVRQLS